MKRLAVLFLLMTAVAACGGSGTAPPSGRASSGAAGPQVLPASSVQTQVSGRPVVYLFTAPGCASCAEEAQALAAAGSGHPAVRFVGVDLSADEPTTFARYIDAIGLTGSPFLWTIDHDGSLARRFGVVSLSSTVFVDSSGKVRFVNSGAKDAATLRAQLSQLN